ncbi:MAG: hypothetical protein Q8Q02_10825 [Nocardioides sp.]|nr:hypothetical protein [Nocardioides sp.]
MTTLVDAPTRVDGVQLIGAMVGSGYRNPPALVRRGDGQVLQLTPLLYLVLSAVDGRRSCEEIAEVVGTALGRGVTGADVTSLVDGHLRPLGLVDHVEGEAPELERSNPLLGLKFRVAVTNPRTTRRITDPFRLLFRPMLAVPVVLGFVAVVSWVFFERGLGASAYDAFERPHLLLLVFAVSVLSGGFHEFGHAAAARYSGAQPGVMGAGLYLVWPAFYTDVTDSYRLGRGGRIRTDLGGLYFNAIVVVLTFVWWWATGWEALLLLVATQVLQMTQQLLPLLRFDGYHLLADLAGVPDLYHRIKPTLVGLLPHRWSSPENRMLKPWSRGVITLWVLVTIPMMAMMLLAIVAAVPRLLATAGSAARADADAVGRAWSAGSVLDGSGHVLQLLGVVLPVVACFLILGRFGTRFFKGLARWSQGSAGKRVAAAVFSTVMVTALSWAWYPHPGNYRPIEPGEQRLITSLLPGPLGASANVARPAVGWSAVPAVYAGTAAHERLSTDRPLLTAFPEGREIPTKGAPALAMILVPAGGDGPGVPSDDPGRPSSGGGTTQPDGTWVFPFNEPLPPAEGDNQALAVNTTDGSVTYDIAFALVWAEGDEVVNVNAAHAYASCTDCVTVAVAYQVVLIMDHARVVIPQNLAAAVNYECYECITAAIASQLVLTVEDVPGEEQLRSLGAIWNQLIDFGRQITAYSVAEIAARLQSFSDAIVAILGGAPAVAPQTSTPTAGTDTSTADPSGTSSPSPAPSSSSPTAEPSPTGTTTSSPTGTTSSTPTSPSPTPSPSTVEASPESTTGSTSPSAEPSEPTPSPTSSSETDSSTVSPSP